jgi:pimeloyl-ACP methyl ester carboxylesterase
MAVTACAATRASSLPTIRTPTVDFNVEQRGAKPRVVFLHGFGSDLHTWDLLWRELDGSLQMLRYDLRDYGASVGRAGAYSHSEDLLALLNTRAIADCDLVGVSMGGGVALNFALDHPERVRRLVLISPDLVGWEWSREWRELSRPIVTLARHGELAAARQLWWQHPLFATTRASCAGPALLESIQHFSGAQWLHDEHRPMMPDVERLHRLAASTLLLTGGRDMGEIRVIAGLIENSTTTVQRIDEPALGHLIHLEDPRGCAQNISEFLALR